MKDRINVADRLVELALGAGLELFRTPDSDYYGRVPVSGHIEVLKLRGKAFRQWLTSVFYESEKRSPGDQSKQDAIDTLEARAYAEGHIEPIYTRIAGKDDCVYLDLVNDAWQVVEISSYGWKVLDTSPVNFRRSAGMQPLPTPVHGGSIDELRPFVNLGSDEEWVLTLSWLVAAYHPTGPYPVLVFSGQAGAAKSTTARVLRSLIDPNAVPLRSEPREMREIAIAASNSWVQTFDNLSRVPVWFSDALCTLSTGGGSGARMLYTDDEEKLFNAKRPTILTGIEELATRNDLLDRAILLYPKRVEKYRPEKELWEDFIIAQPSILGAVLDAVSVALDTVEYVSLERVPRMADFATWSVAAETGFGFEPGTFMNAYNHNQGDANQLAIEASPIAQAIIDLLDISEMCDRGCWEGTAKELLDFITTDEHKQDRSWPKNGIGMGNALTRIAYNLQTVGIQVEKYRPTNGTRKGERLIQIKRVA